MLGGSGLLKCCVKDAIETLLISLHQGTDFPLSIFKSQLFDNSIFMCRSSNYRRRMQRVE